MIRSLMRGAVLVASGLAFVAVAPKHPSPRGGPALVSSVAHAQTPTAEPQPAPPPVGVIRQLRLESAAGPGFAAIYWLDGDYIPEVLGLFSSFLSELAGAEVIGAPILLDKLSALQRLSGNTVIIEQVSPSSGPGEPVRLSVALPGREPGEICETIAMLYARGVQGFCRAETGSPARPLRIDSSATAFDLTWQDGPTPPAAELLAGLERGSPAANGGMGLQFLRPPPSEPLRRWRNPGDTARACTHRLDGELRPGDGARLSEALTGMATELAHARSRGQLIGRMVLCLDSPGGALLDGLQIAEALLQAGIPTRIEAGARCESACFWVFMAGNIRSIEGPAQPVRVLSPGGRLGFHAPALDISIPDPTTAEIGAAMQLGIQAAARISAVFAETGGFADGRPILKPSLLTEMLGTAPERMRVIETVGDAGRWDIQLDLEPPGPVAERAFRQACANQIAWSRDLSVGTQYRDFHVTARATRIEIGRLGQDELLCSFDVRSPVIEAGRLRQAQPVGYPAMLFIPPQTGLASLATE